jgi:hypothetical protein
MGAQHATCEQELFGEVGLAHPGQPVHSAVQQGYQTSIGACDFQAGQSGRGS